MSLGLEPEYVLDRMTRQEAAALMKYSYYKNKVDWERTRFNAYCTVQIQSKKRIRPEDLIKFNWEKESEVHIPTDEEIKQVAEWAKQIRKNRKMSDIKINIELDSSKFSK